MILEGVLGKGIGDVFGVLWRCQWWMECGEGCVCVCGRQWRGDCDDVVVGVDYGRSIYGEQRVEGFFGSGINFFGVDVKVVWIVYVLC